MLLRSLGLGTDAEIIEKFGEGPKILETIQKDTSKTYEEGLLDARPIQITPATNTGSGKSYAATLNTIEATYASSFENNTVTRALEYYVRYQKTTAETSTVRLAYYTDSVSKDFVLSPGMAPFQDRYADQPWYNSYTKDYYALKSYLEQIERMGGGSITLTAGTYSITNSLFVPSNTTFNLQDGVVLNKGTNTGFSTTVLAPSLSMFQLVPPSLSTVTGAVSGYEGSQNVSFIGNGNVTIDMLFYNCAKSFVLCHNKNVTIKGINFRNYMGHHFIELDASQNVVIENCTFEGSKFTSSSDDHKEAINIDIPDKNTGGFNQIWTSYDRTPNMDIFIKNNSFNNVLRAIGTHKYSVSALDNTTQVYHTNVQILNNTISNTLGYAIRSINWKDCVIKGNTIKNVGKGEETAIFMS